MTIQEIANKYTEKVRLGIEKLERQLTEEIQKDITQLAKEKADFYSLTIPIAGEITIKVKNDS